jgi:hypothetical protein
MKHAHLAKQIAKLAVLPFFAFLALGSSSPKKGEQASSSSSNASSTTTTTSAVAGGVLGSCMQTDNSSCYELYSFGIATEDQKKKSCSQLHGTYQSKAACPTKDTLLGVCTESSLLDPAQVREKMFYYDEGKNKDSGGQKTASSACSAMMGSWADHPGFVNRGASAAAAAPAPKADTPPTKKAASAKKKKK